MTLKELCKRYKNSPTRTKSSVLWSQYLTNPEYTIDDLEASDTLELSAQELANVLAMIEYIANNYKVDLPAWYDLYDDFVCPVDSTDWYVYLNKLNLSDSACNSMYETAMEKALPEFKRRGLPYDSLSCM